MSNLDSALYSNYGAFELKSKYQRNFMLGTASMVALVLLILGVFQVMALISGEAPISDKVHVIKTVADLGPPPTIVKKPPQVKIDQPDIIAPKVGIPKPVADDEVLDDDVQLATREEMAQILAPDIASDQGDDIVVDIDEDDYLPSMDDFVPVEIIAEMIHYETPAYPRLAEQAGLEGLVWIKALIGSNGKVLDAVVYKSSGTPSLDEAALVVARDNTFKPAIQNGRPVAMWVTYKVEFTLANQ